MISRKDLESRYAGYSNEELLDVLRNKEGYTALAVELAQEELSRRNVTSEEIAVMEEDHAKKVEYFLENFARVDMRFSQKSFFYFLWVPLLHFAMKQNLREDGYLKMVKQAGYYSIMGFIFFMVAGFSVAIMPSIGWLLWPLGLFVANFLEKFFVKRDI